MVGGLVEAKEWIGRHEHLREGETSALTTGENAHALLDVIAVEEEGTKEATLL